MFRNDGNVPVSRVGDGNLAKAIASSASIISLYDSGIDQWFEYYRVDANTIRVTFTAELTGAVFDAQFAINWKIF